MHTSRTFFSKGMRKPDIGGGKGGGKPIPPTSVAIFLRLPAEAHTCFGDITSVSNPPHSRFLLSSLCPLTAQNKPVFVTGMTGTGKTVTVQNLLSSLEPAEEEGGQNVVPMTVNFSAQTSSLVTQVRRVQSGAGSGSASEVLPPRQDALNDFRGRLDRIV